MRLPGRSFALLLFWASSLMSTVGCQTGGSVSGNEKGSQPVNETEATEYKKAIVRCYKTGGSRVVKIMGELRCY